MNRILIAPDFWEEHCIECGAPACYATCEKFIKGPGGHCRRFANGIQRRGDAFAIRFLPWGKLEMYWQGRMATPSQVRLARAFRAVTAPLVRLLFGEFAVRGLLRRVTRWLGTKAVRPNALTIDCQCDHDEDLLLSVVNVALEDLLVRRIVLKTGSNHVKVDLPRSVAEIDHAFFRLASIEGSHGEIVFEKCEVCFCEDTSSTPAKFVKCLAWDLDNTLWRGVLVEDGAAGVELRDEAVRLIKMLDSRGILNTICSKNDWIAVRPVLEKFNVIDYFVFPQVNWNPKSANLRKVAEEINIGVDALAFIDDSPSERGEVMDHLPMVRVFAKDEFEKIEIDPAFNPPISSESATRRVSYLAEMSRRKDEVSSEGTRLDFLCSCDIRLVCEKVSLDVAKKAAVKRCWELVNRTNQLTLAARRYDEDAFASLIKETEAFAVHCSDKYGDYGIVGFIALSTSDRQSTVREFVMSCRVAKKLCEQSVLLFMAERMKANNCENMSATVVPTGRNKALVDAFDVMPFRKRNNGGAIVYSVDLLKLDSKDVFRHKCQEE